VSFRILGGKFNFGINIDDMWRYAGLPDPPSTVVPFFLTKKTYNGRFSLPSGDNKATRKYESRDFTDSLTLDENKHDTKKLAKELAKFLKGSRIDYVRCWFPWNFFEPSIGSRYRFPLDIFVNEMNDADIGIIAVIGDGYGRFLPKNVQTSNIDAYNEHLIKSSTEIVRHYKNKVKVWQIENEPDWWKAHVMAGWRSGMIWLRERNQEPMLSALAEVVRNECPKSTIVINLASSGPKVKWDRYAKYCDIIGVDPYPSYIRPDMTDVSEIAKVSHEANKATGLPIYIIETGYPTGPHFLGFNEEHQSKYVASACKYATSNDEVKGLGMYRFSDSYWKSFPTQENYFGLLTIQGEPKPAWHEYVSQIKKMKGRSK
jgi:hypothetical protein